MTYDTKPDPVILAAVNKTLEKVAEANKTQEGLPDQEDGNSTVTPEEALNNSLLSSIDVTKDSVTQAQLTEAYCRDVDSFSWEFGAPRNQQQQQGRDWNRHRTAVGVGSGTIVLIVLLLCGTCCTCGICLALKKKRSKSSEPPVTFSDVHVNDTGMGMGNVTANPGYAEATPQHQVGGAPGYPAPAAAYSNTGAVYPGPAAIPPTQPGYTNFPGSEGQGNPSPYPPQPAAYPPQAAAYPPQGAPYPPQNAPYPPADNQASTGGLPYPPQPSQPAYNPY